MMLERIAVIRIPCMVRWTPDIILPPLPLSSVFTLTGALHDVSFYTRKTLCIK